MTRGLIAIPLLANRKHSLPSSNAVIENDEENIIAVDRGSESKEKLKENNESAVMAWRGENPSPVWAESRPCEAGTLLP